MTPVRSLRAAGSRAKAVSREGRVDGPKPDQGDRGGAAKDPMKGGTRSERGRLANRRRAAR